MQVCSCYIAASVLDDSCATCGCEQSEHRLPVADEATLDRQLLALDREVDRWRAQATGTPDQIRVLDDVLRMLTEVREDVPRDYWKSRMPEPWEVDVWSGRWEAHCRGDEESSYLGLIVVDGIVMIDSVNGKSIVIHPMSEAWRDGDRIRPARVGWGDPEPHPWPVRP